MSDFDDNNGNIYIYRQVISPKSKFQITSYVQTDASFKLGVRTYTYKLSFINTI